MHVAFGRVRRRIALLRTSFSLMRNDYLEMVLQTPPTSQNEHLMSKPLHTFSKRI